MARLPYSKIVVTGGGGFLGAELVRALEEEGHDREALSLPGRSEYDLRLPEDCARATAGKELAFHCAARVGTLEEQRARPGEFFYDNALMAVEFIEAARAAGMKKIIFPSTVHAYPACASLPLEEKDLWSGYPEADNAPYGLAKRLAHVALEAYRAQYGLKSAYCILPNLVGISPGKPAASFLRSVLEKICRAKLSGEKRVELRGTGKAIREFLHVRDAARALILAARSDFSEPLNIGSGESINLKDLAALIKEEADFRGEIVWTGEKMGSDVPRYLSQARAARVLGFSPRISLREGVREMVEYALRSLRP